MKAYITKRKSAEVQKKYQKGKSVKFRVWLEELAAGLKYCILKYIL